jgi:predicted O-methyltransferase YrrM
MAASDLKFHHKLLPNQHAYSDHFQGTDVTAALFERICASSGIQDARDELSIELPDNFAIEDQASNPVSLRFLQILFRLARVKRVLEIGSFIGISAIYFAKALPPDGEVVTIEKFDYFAGIARRNFARNGFEKKIKLLEGDAFEVIDSLRGQTFDVVFIDGNKERYKDYFIAAESLVALHGIVLVDDCFFHGDALNDRPTTEKGRGVRAFLDYAATRNDWLRVALPLANGIMIMMRDHAKASAA